MNRHHLTPSQKPLTKDDLVVLLAPQRLKGFCAQVVFVDRFMVGVSLLDNELESIVLDRAQVVQTGKQPSDLVSLYEPSDDEFVKALGQERELPDFTKVRKVGKRTAATRSKGVKVPTNIKDLSDVQKAVLKKALMEVIGQMKGGMK